MTLDFSNAFINIEKCGQVYLTLHPFYHQWLFYFILFSFLMGCCEQPEWRTWSFMAGKEDLVEYRKMLAPFPDKDVIYHMMSRVRMYMLFSHALKTINHKWIKYANNVVTLWVDVHKIVAFSWRNCDILVQNLLIKCNFSVNRGFYSNFIWNLWNEPLTLKKLSRFCLSYDRIKLDFIVLKVGIISIENATLSGTRYGVIRMTN